MATTLTSPHEARARNRKARAIAAEMRRQYEAQGSTFSLQEAARRAPEWLRAQFAEAAGQRPPSEATWAVVVDLLGEPTETPRAHIVWGGATGGAEHAAAERGAEYGVCGTHAPARSTYTAGRPPCRRCLRILPTLGLAVPEPWEPYLERERFRSLSYEERKEREREVLIPRVQALGCTIRAGDGCWVHPTFGDEAELWPGTDEEIRIRRAPRSRADLPGCEHENAPPCETHGWKGMRCGGLRHACVLCRPELLRRARCCGTARALNCCC